MSDGSKEERPRAVVLSAEDAAGILSVLAHDCATTLEEVFDKAWDEAAEAPDLRADIAECHRALALSKEALSKKDRLWVRTSSELAQKEAELTAALRRHSAALFNEEQATERADRKLGVAVKLLAEVQAELERLRTAGVRIDYGMLRRLDDALKDTPTVCILIRDAT